MNQFSKSGMRLKVILIVVAVLLLSLSGAYAYSTYYAINDSLVDVSNSTVTINNSTITMGENNTFLNPPPTQTGNPQPDNETTATTPPANASTAMTPTITYVEVRRNGTDIFINYEVTNGLILTIFPNHFYLIDPEGNILATEPCQRWGYPPQLTFRTDYSGTDYQLCYDFPVTVNWVKLTP